MRYKEGSFQDLDSPILKTDRTIWDGEGVRSESTYSLAPLSILSLCVFSAFNQLHVLPKFSFITINPNITNRQLFLLDLLFIHHYLVILSPQVDLRLISTINLCYLKRRFSFRQAASSNADTMLISGLNALQDWAIISMELQ